jgi:hypothetical protein
MLLSDGIESKFTVKQKLHLAFDKIWSIILIEKAGGRKATGGENIHNSMADIFVSR